MTTAVTDVERLRRMVTASAADQRTDDHFLMIITLKRLNSFLQ